MEGEEGGLSEGGEEEERFEEVSTEPHRRRVSCRLSSKGKVLVSRGEKGRDSP